MEDFIQQLPDLLIDYGLKIIAAVVIFLIGRWVAGLLSRLFERLLLRSDVDQTLASFVRNLSYYLILVFVSIAAIDKIGVKTTSLVAVLGAAVRSVRVCGGAEPPLRLDAQRAVRGMAHTPRQSCRDAVRRAAGPR